MDPFEGFKAAQKAGWAHFAPLQTTTTPPAGRLVKFSGITKGMKVLDVACGTGVVAITAARAGAVVTGLDLTPELVAVARDNSKLAGVDVTWQEGDAEQLPFPDASFDAVLSQYGHMFAPRPDVAIAEMLRVLKPGGIIAFSTWPPELFIGRMFILVSRYAPPPPPGAAPPPLWGDPSVVRERLGDRVGQIKFDRSVMRVSALSVPHVRDMFEHTAGPMIKLVEMLSASDPAKLATFRKEFDALVAEYIEDNEMSQGFLMTRAVKNA